MSNENLRTVYEQYWLHARHVERETWLFTSVYVAIVGAIFAAVGANICSGIKIGVTAFGALLSLLGFFVVYTQRIPFLKFILMAELIAINEFKIKDEYRRFFPKGGKVFPKNKFVDTDDILSMFYSTLTGAMVFLCIKSYNENFSWSAIVPAFVLFLSLVIVHFRIIRPKKYIKEISEELEKYINDQNDDNLQMNLKK